LLDFTSIKQNPKIFVGFSDVSALLSAFYAKCGFVTFHGPVVSMLGDAARETRERLFSVITSDLRYEIKTEKGVGIRPGSASGPVAGGNLTTLCHLIGTEFEPDFRGHILFLEDRGEAIYRIDRMLTQMKLAGCLNGIAGIALGSFEDCGPINEIIGVVENVFKDFHIPILSGFNIGHGRNNITVPLGLNATLDTDKRSLLFHTAPTVDRG
jgi:muramoyltetrapeptide carboxypeptidase